MRGFRLNGWQRIGIVLSVVWAIGGALYARHAEIKSALDMYSVAYGNCSDADTGQNNFDFSDCKKQAGKIIERGEGWGNPAIVAFAPIPIAWLLAYMLVGLVRWIQRGFKPST